MTAIAIDTLLDIHTATHDVLKGYREMVARAKPDVESVIRRLTEMHERHAAEQHAELLRLREAHKDGSSLRGAVNKVMVILRDWLSDIDRDILPAVRDGEESLRGHYDKALEDESVVGAPTVAALLKTQRGEISTEIARLPKD